MGVSPRNNSGSSQHLLRQKCIAFVLSSAIVKPYLVVHSKILLIHAWVSRWVKTSKKKLNKKARKRLRKRMELKRSFWSCRFSFERNYQSSCTYIWIWKLKNVEVQLSHSFGDVVEKVDGLHVKVDTIDTKFPLKTI